MGINTVIVFKTVPKYLEQNYNTIMTEKRGASFNV
jgi:hypothetical protein